MAISRDVSTNEQDKFVESTATTGQVGVAVVNPDGSSISGGAGGTQYTEGDTDASITGTALLWEDTSDTLRAASAAKPLPVDVKSVAPGTYAVDDSAMPATPQTVPVSGEYRSAATTYTDGDATVLQTDVNGNTKVTQATLLAGEDLTNDVLKTEQRFSYAYCAGADTAVKSGAGFLHTLTFSQIDAAPTAGTIIVYDNTAESGTIIFSSTWTTAVFMPTTVTIDASFATGLYIGFTTTNDIGVSVSYR